MGRTRTFSEEEVLEIAKDLFWAKGYHAVSTQDLIDAFGISKSSMYGAFKDKRSLFVLALRRYMQQNSQQMIRLLRESEDFLPTITQILHNLIEQNACDKACKGCFVANTAVELAPHDAEILSIIQDNRQQIVSALETAIQRAISTGEIHTRNHPKALANYLFTLINGLQVDAKLATEKSLNRQTVEVALAQIIA